MRSCVHDLKDVFDPGSQRGGDRAVPPLLPPPGCHIIVVTVHAANTAIAITRSWMRALGLPMRGMLNDLTETSLRKFVFGLCALNCVAVMLLGRAPAACFPCELGEEFDVSRRKEAELSNGDKGIANDIPLKLALCGKTHH
jgi:hypothetical protein